MAVKMEMREVPSHIGDLLTRVRNGKEITLAEAGEPVARLIPFASPPGKRAFGLFKGRVWMADDFDAPLPEEELREWEK
jgi:prevent-host-death family protein